MSGVILRVRNKEGSTRVSLPPSATLNDLIRELQSFHKMDVNGPEELFWDLGGTNPILLGSKGQVDASEPLGKFNLTHGCLVYVKKQSQCPSNAAVIGRSLVEDKESIPVAEKKDSKALGPTSKDTYTSLKGLPAPPPQINDNFSSHDSLRLDDAYHSDSKNVRAPDSVQCMTLVDDGPAPTDSLSVAYARYDHAMEEQIKRNALELGMTEWEMQLEIQRLRDERMAQRMQAEMLLENFGSLEDDMDDYLREVDDTGGAGRSQRVGAGGRGKQRPRRRSRRQSIDCPSFLEEEEEEEEGESAEALIQRMDSLLGIAGSGSQRKQKGADAKHADSKSTPKKSAARGTIEGAMIAGVKASAVADTAARIKSVSSSSSSNSSSNSNQQWSRNNKGRSNSFDILQEDDAGDDGDGDEDYLLSKRLQREERDFLDAFRLQQQMQEEEDAALAQQVQGQPPLTPQPALRAPLADILLPREEEEEEEEGPTLELLEQQQRLFFERREVERDRMRSIISGGGTEPFRAMQQSLESSLDETILNLALAQSTIPTRQPAETRLGDSDEDDDLAKALLESLKYK